MKHRISRRYIVRELELRIGLENVPKTIGWGQWCEQDFLDILRSRSEVVLGIKSIPLFDGDGNFVEVEITATVDRLFPEVRK